MRAKKTLRLQHTAPRNEVEAVAEPIDATPTDELTDRSEQLRLARELRAAAAAQVDLILDLPPGCREHVLNGETLEATSSRGWPFERLDKYHDRLATYVSAHPDAGIEDELRCSRRLKLRITRARDALILTNLGIVPHVVKEFVSDRIPLTDLIQEGYLGLLKAVDRFDPERGYAFSTYACWWIRRALNDAFAYRARLIRLPENVRRGLGHLRLASSELEAALGRRPTEAELAVRLRISHKRVRKLLSVVKEPGALEDLGPDSNSDWDSFVGGSFVPDPLESTLRDEMRQHTDQALKTLSPREQTIVRMRFGFEGSDGQSLAEVARVVGVSRERVRQIERRALEKMERWVRRAGIGTH
jgi:RNA polymerase sigma factor (sigma-70 family)